MRLYRAYLATVVTMGLLGAVALAFVPRLTPEILNPVFYTCLAASVTAGLYVYAKGK